MRPLPCVLLIAVLAQACNCGPPIVPDVDGGTDAGAVDAGHDAGTLQLPIFRVGPRSAFQGSFGQQPISGTLTLPVTAGTPADFTGWTLSSPVFEGAVTFAALRDDGGLREADFSVALSSATGAPIAAREVFTAASPDGGTVLKAVLDPLRVLHFTLESTALQALALSEVRREDAVLYEAYYFGAASLDRPELDVAVPAVAAAMRARLAATGSTGISPNGLPFPGTPVFDAIDSARAAPGLAAPAVRAGASSLHLTEVTLSGAPGTLALFAGGRVPQPSLTIPAGVSRVALFLYAFDPASEPLFVKFATLDGGQTPASARFLLPEPLGTGPAEPALTFDAGVATACGLTTGHQVVFFSSGTEVAVGFAAAAVGPGQSCVTLSQVPAGVGLLNAAQVAPDGRVGSPSNIVFP